MGCVVASFDFCEGAFIAVSVWDTAFLLFCSPTTFAEVVTFAGFAVLRGVCFVALFRNKPLSHIILAFCLR